jgi:hypothetical protein
MADELIYTPREEGFWSFDLGDKILDLSDALIPAMTQEQSATYLSPKGFNTCTLPQFFLVGSKLHGLKDSVDDKVREAVKSAHQFVKQGIRNSWLNTQTRISYSPDGQDTITHDYGRANHSINRTNFVGKDGSPENVLSLESSLALTGRKPEEVNAIMGYLNGTSNYVWRLNSKPINVDERVVGLYANSDGFGLGCNGNPQDARASFGVRLREKNKEGSH